MTKKRSFRKGLRNLPLYIFLIIASGISLFPLYFVLASSTNTSAAINAGSLTFGSNFFRNFRTLVSNHNVGSALWHSLRNAGCVTLCTLVVCSTAGYGFEIYHDRAKDKVMTFVMMTIMIPFVAIMVPLYKMFSQLGLLNTIWCILLPGIYSPVMIMLFRNSSRSFPYDLVDAARIDGESELGIFFKIYIPVMKPTFAAASVMTFMSAWNNFMWTKITQTKATTMTLTVMISVMTGDNFSIDYGEVMMALLITILPIAVLFVTMQKYYVEGMSGSVKG